MKLHCSEKRRLNNSWGFAQLHLKEVYQICPISDRIGYTIGGQYDVYYLTGLLVLVGHDIYHSTPTIFASYPFSHLKCFVLFSICCCLQIHISFSHGYRVPKPDRCLFFGRYLACNVGILLLSGIRSLDNMVPSFSFFVVAFELVLGHSCMHFVCCLSSSDDSAGCH